MPGTGRCSATGVKSCGHESTFESGYSRVTEVNQIFTVRGNIKWYGEAKGFGFIQQESGPDVFAHFSNIKGDGFRTLAEGQKVEFTVTQGQKGPQAENIVAL